MGISQYFNHQYLASFSLENTLNFNRCEELISSVFMCKSLHDFLRFYLMYIDENPFSDILFSFRILLDFPRYPSDM